MYQISEFKAITYIISNIKSSLILLLMTGVPKSLTRPPEDKIPCQVRKIKKKNMKINLIYLVVVSPGLLIDAGSWKSNIARITQVDINIFSTSFYYYHHRNSGEEPAPDRNCSHCSDVFH